MRRKACPLKVPRLRMKDELLKSAPALANLLGEEIEDPDREYNNNRLDTPRGHDKEISEAEELRQELSAVKKDRAELIQSLAHIKTNLVGTGGGEAQRSQIQQLEHELEIKKLTLNELRTSSKKLVKKTADVMTSISDAKLLTPKGYENEIITIKQLMADISRLEEDLIEAEAKNRLYYLLGERTRHDHLEMEGKVRVARETKNDALEDHATLTQMMHDMRAAREEAERQLTQMKKMLEDAKKDWLKKMKDRKNEVQELTRRQEREELKELKRKEQQEEDMRKEQERLKRIALEQEAHEMQIQELAPKIEAMEASWNRLRTITGADEPEEVIAYWEGLKSKEENMRQLVANAEANESNVKAKIEDLLSRRNEVLEVDGTPQTQTATGNSADYEIRISDAHRKMKVMRTKFEKLRTVCISSDQALKGVLDRVKVALRELEPSELAPASKIPQGTPPRQSKKLDRRESNGTTTASIRFWQCSVTGKGLSSRESNRRNATPLSDEAGNSDRAPDAMRSTPNSDSLVNLGPTSNAAEDDIFFESLPGLVQEVTEKLTLLLDLESESIAVGDIPINPPATDGIGAVPEVDPREETEGQDPDASTADSSRADGDAAVAGEAGADPEAAVPDVQDTEDITEATGIVGACDDALASEEATGIVGACDDALASEDATAPEGDADAAQPADGEEPVAGADVEGEQAAAEGEGAVQPDAAIASGGAEESLLEPTAAEGNGAAPQAAQDIPQELPPFVQRPTILDELLESDEVLQESEIEKRLLMINKTMPKLDWSGAPLVDTVNPDLKGKLPDLSAMTKRVKGRRKPEKVVALDRIMGCTEEEKADDDDDEEDDGDDDDKDAVVDREQIKRMAAKMETRAAKARAEAAE